MNFEYVLNNRKSIRQFRDEPVPEQVLTTLLETALSNAPSSSNTQPYRIAVAIGNVRDEIRQELLRKYEHASKINEAPLPVKVIRAALSKDLPDGDYNPNHKYPPELKKRASECGHGLYKTLGIERSDKVARARQTARNFEFFDAPVALFVFAHESLGMYSAIDAGIFIQTLTLTATSMGLGTCIQGALGMWASPVKKRFDVPKEYKLLCGMSLGYPDDSHVINQFRPVKRRLNEVLLPVRQA